MDLCIEVLQLAFVVSLQLLLQVAHQILLLEMGLDLLCYLVRKDLYAGHQSPFLPSHRHYFEPNY